jgi:hypothetical protein
MEKSLPRIRYSMNSRDSFCIILRRSSFISGIFRLQNISLLSLPR